MFFLSCVQHTYTQTHTEKRQSFHQLEENANLQVINSNVPQFFTDDSYHQIQASGEKNNLINHHDQNMIAPTTRSNDVNDGRNRQSSQNRYQAEKEFVGRDLLDDGELRSDSNMIHIHHHNQSFSLIKEIAEGNNYLGETQEKQKKITPEIVATHESQAKIGRNKERSSSSMLRHDSLLDYPPSLSFDPTSLFMDGTNHKASNAEFFVNSEHDIITSASEQQPEVNNKSPHKWTEHTNDAKDNVDSKKDQQPVIIASVKSVPLSPSLAEMNRTENSGGKKLAAINSKTRQTSHIPQLHTVDNTHLSPINKPNTLDTFKVIGSENRASK